MSDYFEWIFFNTSANKYDTLRSRLSLQANGEKIATNSLDSEGFNGFYSLIKESNNDVLDIHENMTLKIIVNCILLAILGLLAYQIIHSKQLLNLKTNNKFLKFKKK